MSTRKSKEEINQTLAAVIGKEFKHKGEIAEELGIHPVTLNKWVKNSDFTWADFNINYTKSLEKRIINQGGIDYLKEKFTNGWQIKDIAEDLNSNPITTNTIVDKFLKDNGLTKYDLNYKKHPPNKRNHMFNLIEEKGGIPYLLSSKMEDMSIYDIVNDIGEGITRMYVNEYLNKYGLTYTSLYEYNNVYYIHHLKKWRGTVINNGIVQDTELCDDIYSALDQVEKLKKLK